MAADFFAIEAWTRRGYTVCHPVFHGIVDTSRMRWTACSMASAICHDRAPLFTAEFLSLLAGAGVASVKLPRRSLNLSQVGALVGVVPGYQYQRAPPIAQAGNSSHNESGRIRSWARRPAMRFLFGAKRAQPGELDSSDESRLMWVSKTQKRCAGPGCLGAVRGLHGQRFRDRALIV